MLSLLYVVICRCTGNLSMNKEFLAGRILFIYRKNSTKKDNENNVKQNKTKKNYVQRTKKYKMLIQMSKNKPSTCIVHNIVFNDIMKLGKVSNQKRNM